MGPRHVSKTGSAERAQVGGFSLTCRVWAFRALRCAYALGTVVGSVLLLVLGGFVPVLGEWVENRARRWSDVVAILGGTWVGPERPSEADAGFGPLLRPSDAALLFDDLNAIARKLGTRRPQQVRLAYLPCCGVTSWGRDRALMVGLPLLYTLNRGELRAVLAHELAHLARGDAAHAEQAARFLDRLALGLEQPRPGSWGGPLRGWARFCHRLGCRLIAPVALSQESRADRAAATIAGGDVAASALVKVALVQAVFREVLDHYDRDHGQKPNLYAFFREFWGRLPGPFHTGLRHRLFTGSGPARSSVNGTHPALLDRLQAVQAFAPVPGSPEAAAPASTVLGDLEAMELLLHDRLYGIRELAPSTFHRAGS